MLYPSGSAESHPEPSARGFPATTFPSAPVSFTSPTFPSATVTVTGSPGATSLASFAGLTVSTAGFGAGLGALEEADSFGGSLEGVPLHPATVRPITPAATSSRTLMP